MKKITNLLAVFLMIAFATNISAQNTCCGSSTVAPEVSSGLHSTLIPLDANTPTLSLAVAASADLPTVEFLITKRGVAALNGLGTADTVGGGGDVVIGAVISNGVFQPQDKSRYGISLAVGDTFDLTAIGYDLAIIKTLADSLLNGHTNGTTPCCNLFAIMSNLLNQPALAGFCDSVNNAGIHNANDINSMEDVLVIFDAFATGQVSIGSIVSTMQTINSSGTYISTDCGGTGANDFLPYGIHKNKQYGYITDNAIAVRKLSDVALFMMYPNPVTADVLNINFTTTQTVDLAINVYNTLGKRVATKTLGMVNGDVATSLDMSILVAGVYVVELTDGQNSETHKFVVK